MTQGAVSRLLSIFRSQKLWMFGLVIGFVGGYATLQINPFAAVLELLLVWIVVASPSPRLSGLAGALVGHGAAWSWLLITSSIVCSMSCIYTLAYGPAHVTDSVAWQTETRVWFAVAVGVFLLGLVLTIWTARLLRQANRGVLVVAWLLLIAALSVIALNPTNPAVPSPWYALFWLGVMAVARGISMLLTWVSVAVDLSLFLVCVVGMEIGGLILVPSIIAFAVADALNREPATAT